MDATQFAKALSVGESSRVLTADTRVQGLVTLAAQMGQPAPDKDAPVREVIARLGDNWSPLILKVLQTGSFRHASLKRIVGMLSAESEISQRMLTLRLKALERDGFVSRHVEDRVPPRVTYSLTPLGADLTDQLNILLGWIDARQPDIIAARERFRP